MSEQSQPAVARRQPFAGLESSESWVPLRSVMDDLFNDGARRWAHREVAEVPSVDITETDDAYKIRAELAGCAKEDIAVEVLEGVLSVRGEKKSRRDEKLERGRRLECSYGAFSRSFTLPQDADGDSVSAEFHDGILDLTIAKRPETKPKQIAVKG